MNFISNSSSPLQPPQPPKISQVDGKVSSSQSQQIKNEKSLLSKKIKNIFGKSFLEEVKLLKEPPAIQGRFKNWRSSEDPNLDSEPLEIDTSSISGLMGLGNDEIQAIEKQCIDQYEKANQAFEHAIGDTVLKYVYPNGVEQSNSGGKGPLLEFSNKLSSRYLDLYRAYIKYEIANNIPMISNAAGQMKNHGFESQEILAMKEDCQTTMNLLNGIKLKILENSNYATPTKNDKVLNEEGKALYNEIREILFVKEKREDFISKSKNMKELQDDKALLKFVNDSIDKYKNLKEVSNIDRASFMMSSFAKMNFDQIEHQIYEVANLQANTTAKEDERLLMEIRHRVGGEGSVTQDAPGSVGQNPSAYLNFIRKGEPNNPEGEFREQMYFVYMSNHFANTVMKNSKLIEYTNSMLEQEKQDWRIDIGFVEDMNNRGPSSLPPIFRYGSQANLNSNLRSLISKKEKEEYLEQHPNPTLKEVMDLKEGQDLNKNFRYKLTNREVLNQFGVRDWKEADADQKLKFVTGAAVFHLKEIDELPQVSNDKRVEFAKKYIKMVKELKIPTAAGISGTLDQSTTMIGLVGIGIGNNKDKELEQIKLAYLAFMVPNTDHSVHEIMQSTKTFGLEYVPGPGFEKYIYPSGGENFIKHLEQAQKERNFELPSYYLGKKYVNQVANQLRNEQEKLKI